MATKTTYKAVKYNPGIYRGPGGLYYKKIKGKFVRLPRNTKIITKPSSKGTQQSRGKEISVKKTAGSGQVIYGRFRVGGQITYEDTSSDTKAYLLIGADNSQILWTARTSGAPGNDIQIRIVCSGNNATLTVGVVDNLITITVKSTSSVSQSNRQQVIDAVAANVSANAKVIGKRAGTKDSDFSGDGNVGALSTTNLSFGGGTYLHQYHTLACHEIDEIEDLRLDDRLVTFGDSRDPRWAVGAFANRVFMAKQYGSTDQVTCPDMLAQLPGKITSAFRQRGWAGTYRITIYDQNVFPDNEPQETYTVRGKKCYDPRSGLTVWTQNAALIAADYLTDTRYGRGISWSKIDTSVLSTSADTCDQDIPLLAGGTEKRYTINTAFDTSTPANQILEEMAQAMAGAIVYQGGKWMIYAGESRSISMSLGESNLRGPMKVSTKVAKRDSFNCVRGKYINSSNYEEGDFGAIKNSTYITQDGGEVWEDLTLSMVTSKAQAQRIAKIELEKVRQGIEFSFPADISTLKLKVTDHVSFTFAKYGWSAKEFEVVGMKIRYDPQQGIGTDLVLRETAAAIWDWDTSHELSYDPAPDTNLPDAYTVNEPTDLICSSGTSHLYIRADGTVAPRIFFQWTPPNDQFVTGGGKYLIGYKRTSVSGWTELFITDGSATSVYLSDVQDGEEYDVYITAYNSFNVASSRAHTTHVVVGKTQPPSDVTGFTAQASDFGINFNWNAIPDLDVAEYEIRNGISWDTGATVFKGRGTTARWDIRLAIGYLLWIKAIDTSGNYSTNPTLFGFTIYGPSTPTVSAQIVGENLKLTWTASPGDFAIKEYEIRYGSSYAAGTTVHVVSGLTYEFPIKWGGARTFFVSARDVAGNNSLVAGSTSITIANPNSITGLLSTVVENNVQLRWTAPVGGSLPIDHYNLKKGAVYGSATTIGTVFGTFSTHVEDSGGSFTFWVEAVDTAGNIGTAQSVSVAVGSPTNFVLRDSQNPFAISTGISELNVVSTILDALLEPAGSIYGPVSSVDSASLPLLLNPIHSVNETFDHWFTSNGWTCFQDAVTAGMDSYLLPSQLTAGFIQKVIDYGATIPTSFIKFNWVETQLGAGTVTVAPTISTSPDGTTWTDYAASSAFAANFRYVRYKLTFTASATTDIVRITDVNATLSLKSIEEVRFFTTNASDVAGTVFTFATAFLDVKDIQVTANDAASTITWYTFTDVPNPTSCNIFASDAAGTRKTATVSVRVRGSISPAS